MRIISGTARGTKLDTLKGLDTTRPTTDRVKEAMFSSVQFAVQGAKVLDLFAGSGQLGIEALSRGAKACVFVDENKDAVKIISSNLQKAGLSGCSTIEKTNALSYMSYCNEKFDIIFLDPPYASNLLAEILPHAEKIMQSGGIVLAETSTATNLQEKYGELELKKTYKYGSICFLKFVKV